VAALVVVVLAVAGAFSDDGDDAPSDPTTTPVPAQESDMPDGEPAATAKPETTTVRVGGRPTAISTGIEGVWVADSFSSQARLVEGTREEPIAFRLRGAATDVSTTETGAYFALPEQQAVERRELEDPQAAGEQIDLEGFPSVLAGADGVVYALSDRAVEAIDVDTGEVVDEFRLDGFGSGLAVGDDHVWAAVDNREVVRIDPASGEIDGDPVPVPEVFAVAADGGFVWALAASGELTRIAPETLEATVAPQPVRDALDVAVGLGSVWVTSSRRSVTRLDPGTLEPRGDALPVGDEPASVSVGDEAVWVANGGDGTLTRIEP